MFIIRQRQGIIVGNIVLHTCYAVILLTFVIRLSDSVYNSIEHSTENVRVSYSIRLCTNGYNIHQFGSITML